MFTVIHTLPSYTLGFNTMTSTIVMPKDNSNTGWGTFLTACSESARPRH